MNRKSMAQETLKIVESEPLRGDVARAVAGTRLYRPEDFGAVRAPAPRYAGAVEIVAETTAEAARRYAPEVAALNFASAKNPGGGFLGGAKAQEEDLALASALYPCLLAQREYYDRNRTCGTMLYTHHLIWSPQVPFFRDRSLALVDPYLVSIITSPAPNAGYVSGPAVEETLRERAGHVLHVAAEHDCKTLVLGAWGCGVFRNDPDMVARTFDRWLYKDGFVHAFERVVFAIPGGRSDQNLRAFQAVFA